MRIKEILHDPKKIFFSIGMHGGFNFLSDQQYLKLLYWSNVGKKLNLENPSTYNEKIQWLKLYNRQPEYTMMVDKYEVKKYVESYIGKDKIIPTIGVYNSWEEIDFYKLPRQFVIKCTHDSGGVCICKNKEEFDFKEAKRKINKSLKRNFYYIGREWPYKNVKPRIIIEQYMEDESGYELKDYKFFCFDGRVEMMFLATDRNAKTETCFDFFDKDFNHLAIKNGHPNSTKKIIKPENYDLMISLAEKLSQNIPHVRIDFYNINGKIYFGEMTFYHFSGFVKFEPDEWDYKFGKLLKLPQ